MLGEPLEEVRCSSMGEEVHCSSVGEEVRCSSGGGEDISPNMPKTLLFQNHQVQADTLISDDILNLL